MTVGAVLLAVLAAVGVLALPAWPHSRDWGPAPALTAGVLGAVVLALLRIAH